MKILVYGFGPYKKWKENFSEKVVKKIENRKNLKKVIFPVKFQKGVFLKEIKRFKPDFILGLGQDTRPRSKKIRIERKTKNKWRYNKKEKPKKILNTGPKCYFVNLKIKKDKNSWFCYDATTYACNFSMYVIMDFIKTKNNNIKFAFFHIPRDYNLSKAIKFVESKIDEIINTRNFFIIKTKLLK